MELETVVERALSKGGALDELRSWIENHRHRYRKPRLPEGASADQAFDDMIDELSDWQIRIAEFNRILHRLDVPDVMVATPDALERARVMYELTGLVDYPPTRATVAMRLGIRLHRIEAYADAVVPLTEAARLFGEADMRLEELDALRVLSDCQREGRYFDDLIRTAGDVIDRARRQALKGYEASGLHDLGFAQAALGRESEALDALRQAVTVRRPLSAKDANEQWVADFPVFLNALGMAARRFGFFDEALRAFLECVELHHQNGEEARRAFALSEIGYTYLHGGNIQNAKEYLQRAVRIEERSGPTASSTHWKLQIALIEKQTGVESPLASQEPARREPTPSAASHSETDPAAAAYLDANLASQALIEQRDEDALVLARRALAWADAQRDRELQVVCLNTIGIASERLDRSDEAIAAFQKGIQFADRGGGGAAGTLLLRHNLARVFINSRQYQHAVDVLLMGIASSEELLSHTDSFASRQQIAGAALGLYELYATVLSDNEAQTNHESLLAFTEGVRARNMAAWAAVEAQLESVSASGPETVIAQGERLRALRSAEVELDVRHLTATLTFARANELFADAKRLQSELESLVQVRESDPWNPHESLTRTLEPLLTPDVGILSLFCVPMGVCPVLVSRVNGELVTVGRLIRWEKADRIAEISRWTGTAPTLRSRATRSRPASTNPAAGYDDGDDYEDQEEMQARVACDRMRDALRERLLEPLRKLIDRIRPARLVVIPHRELALLPFWDLMDASPSLRALTLAPSLNLFRICHARERNGPGGTLLIDDVTRSLPFASRELDGVRDLRRTSIVSAHTVDDVIRVAQDVYLLHAAAHGVFNAENPYYSGIVVGARESATGLLVQYVNRVGRSGEHAFRFSATPAGDSYRLLTVGECLSRMRLTACRLAVVSSCECGLADTHSGGELTSVPTSLLVAGAKSVIAAMWPVDDGATALLIDRFYRHWIGGGGSEPSPAVALARARQDLRNLDRSAARAFLGSDAWLPAGERPYAHPLYSDAFQCFGDW
jgi:CHAT domain-containing protein/tetratricopeptide (TPR) repeat protein